MDQGLLWARNSGEKIEPKTRPETSNGPADEEQEKQLKTQQTAPAKPQKPEQKEHATSNSRPTPIPLAKTTKRPQEQSQRAHKCQATAAAGEQPRPRDPPSHPGGGKAEQITRAQGCGLASRRPQRQPPPPATKSRRTCEALAPRDTLKAKPLGAGCSCSWGVRCWIGSAGALLMRWR